mmetsp:Transcript_42455/g.79734  ORF Transcript_42455/g.79734 Transcript_42455/m.79734 type:complete len:96 (+) Transcript_42455:1243-1530(+)
MQLRQQCPETAKLVDPKAPVAVEREVFVVQVTPELEARRQGADPAKCQQQAPALATSMEQPELLDKPQATEMERLGRPSGCWEEACSQQQQMQIP